MNHLVVVSHPREDSFTMNMMRTYVDAVSARGHPVEIRDLYRMNFNPVASHEDLYWLRDGLEAPGDIAVEHEHMRWADVIALFYPVWWISLPAMLKGYIDRVFTLGFTYGHSRQGVQGLLSGRKAIVFTSSGSTPEHFDESGKMSAVNTAIQLGTMEFCSFEMLAHRHFAPVGSRTKDGMVEGWMEEVRALVAEHF